MIDNTVFWLTVIVAGWVGLWMHELTHLLFGKLGGGGAYISKWWHFHLFPIQVDFEHPREMGNLMVRITGGFVVIYPPIGVILATLGWVTPNGWLFIPGAMFLFAGGVSWKDLLAAERPEKWKRYSAGEDISRDDS